MAKSRTRRPGRELTVVKRLSIKDVAASLRGVDRDDAGAPDTTVRFPPVSGANLTLTLEQIKAYDHNPRHAENPEYARIKASIKAARGLNTPLTVTQRPGDTQYMVAAGGNSRLLALREVFAETNDAAYFQIVCQYRAWGSESQVMVAHLIENDVRGNMTLIDKAKAIVALREMFEAEADAGGLSQRQLKDSLDACGFRISLALLNTYLTAVEHVYPYLPHLLDSGLGRPPVLELIRLRKSLRELYAKWGNSDGIDGAHRVFAETCTVQDCHRHDWSFEIFQTALATAVAADLDMDTKLVMLDLNNAMRGIAAPTEPAITTDVESEWVYERARAARQSKLAQTTTPNTGAGDTSPLGDAPSSDPAADSAVGVSVEKQCAQRRQQAADTVRAVVERHGILVDIHRSNHGLGFQLGPRTNAHAVPASAEWVWRLLQILAVGPAQAVEHNRQDSENYFSLDLASFVYTVLLNTDVGNDLLCQTWALVDQCRELAAWSAAHHVDLWSKE